MTPPDSRSVNEFSVDELISVCIARQVMDGDVLAQGINTPLVLAGFILAKCTQAPNVHFACAIGQSLCQEWAPLSVSRVEDRWLDKSLLNVGFATAAADLLPGYKPMEFFRPAQIDAAGNTNNIAIGADRRRPRLRLPGSGGIPDVSPEERPLHFYVPRHSRVTFVQSCDVISGVGHAPWRKPGSGPRYLVSDLGQFDWCEGRMRLTSWHPGVDVVRIRRKTGFELLIAPDACETEAPSGEELRLLREEIDPLGVRKLETLAGGARKDHLRSILQAEGTL